MDWHDPDNAWSALAVVLKGVIDMDPSGGQAIEIWRLKRDIREGNTDEALKRLEEILDTFAYCSEFNRKQAETAQGIMRRELTWISQNGAPYLERAVKFFPEGT